MTSGLLLLLLLSSGRPGFAAPPVRVADFEQDPTLLRFHEVSPGSVQLSGGLLVFQARSLDAGTEPWASDGTPNGTRLVRDIFPGPQNSSPNSFVEFRGEAFFVADSLEYGREIWRTDGSEAGTVLVEDLVPGNAGSFPRSLVATDNFLFFSCGVPAKGRELCVYDGSGTTVFDLELGVGDSSPGDLARVGPDTVCFEAEVGNTGSEPWCSDGTAVGTDLVSNLAAGDASSSPRGFIAAGPDLVLFVATTDAEGRELVLLDLTTGVTQVFDLESGPDGSSPTGFLASSSGVFFVADRQADGREPWWFDPGTRTANIISLEPGPDDSISSLRVAAMGTRVFFVRSDGSLWVTEGTGGSTSPVFTGAGGYESLSTFVWNDGTFLWFVGDESSGDRNLWRFKGSGTFPTSDPPERVSNFPNADESYIDVLGGRASEAWVVTTPAGRSSHSLFVVDPERRGAGAVALSLDVVSRGASLGQMRPVPGGGIVLSAQTAATGREPAIYLPGDGAQLIEDLDPGSGGSNPSDFVAFGPDSVLFTAGFASAIPQEPYLWQEGVVSRVDLLVDGDSEPRDAIRLGNRALVVADDDQGEWVPWVIDPSGPTATQLPPVGWSFERALLETGLVFGAGGEIWLTDGTVAGTESLLVAPGPVDLVVATEDRQRAFIMFSGDPPDNQIWLTDGTAVGTTTEAEFPHPISGSLLMTSGDRALAVLRPSGSLRELAVTDGTMAGTMIVTDRLGAGADPNRTPVLLGTVPGGWVYSDHVPGSGVEPWFTDGVQPPVLLDVWPGDSSSSPGPVGRIGDVLYFFATTPEFGEELWQTDGTVEGTRLAMELHPGPQSEELGDPQDFYGVIADGVVYFEALGPGQDGEELWAWAPALFEDGFEAGDAASWSSAVP